MSSHLALIVTPLNPTTINTGALETYTAITVDLLGTLTVSGSGTDVSTVLFADLLGTVDVTNGGTFTIDGLAAANVGGSINVSGGGTVVEGTNVSVLTPVNFAGAGTLALNQSDLLNLDIASGITGFALGDEIQLNTPITSASYDSLTHTLTVKDGSTVVTQLNVQGTGLSAGFVVTPVGGGLYDIGVACFLPETMVLTDGGERPSSDVRIGDRLLTRTGEAKRIKWIGRRAYSASVAASDPHVAPVLIREGALGEGLPRRDLRLSPCHALWIDGILVEAGQLVNGVSILRPAVTERVEYINFEFEDHDVIFAEGAPAETGCCRGNRAVYDNAEEYAGLYPLEAQGQVKPYCAPRLDCGFEVEAIRQRIDALAGIAAPGGATGALRGWIENLDGRAIRGVASHADSPAPVVLELVIDGAVVGEVIANHERPARVKDGMWGGRCGFQVKLPEGLSPYRRHTVSVRRAADHAELPGSPFMMEAAIPMTAAGQQGLASALRAAAANAGSVADIDRALGFLAGRAEALLQAKSDLAGQRMVRTAPIAAPGWSRAVDRRAA